MTGEFNRQGRVFNKVEIGSVSQTTTLTVAANADQYWVGRKIFLSHEGNGTTDYDNILDRVTVNVTIGSTLAFLCEVHPTGSASAVGDTYHNSEFWQIDLDPGVYTANLNEAFVVTATTFGTNIGGIITLLYQ